MTRSAPPPASVGRKKAIGPGPLPVMSSHTPAPATDTAAGCAARSAPPGWPAGRAPSRAHSCPGGMACSAGADEAPDPGTDTPPSWQPQDRGTAIRSEVPGAVIAGNAPSSGAAAPGTDRAARTSNGDGYSCNSQDRRADAPLLPRVGRLRRQWRRETTATPGLPVSHADNGRRPD